MLRFSRPSVFRERISRISGVPTEGAPLTRRSKLAITSGFLIAAAAAMLLGPNLGSVFAEGDDHASFWRAERARVNQAAMANKPSPAETKRQRLPKQASAYAPTPQPQAQASSSNPFSFLTQTDGRLAAAALTHEPTKAQKKRTPAKMSSKARNVTSRHVCVRLCDGYFFPAPMGGKASEAGCAAACPDSPTRLYSMRSDRIVDAVAVRTGAAYARLPVALLYTSERNQTCSCGQVDPAKAILTDANLRRGDRYMTENGFLIYQGKRQEQISQRDFKPIAKVRGISRRERNLLLAMERVSLPRPSERLAARPAFATVAALGPPRWAHQIALR